MKYVPLLILLLAGAARAQAHSDPLDPIDVAMNACTESSQGATTQGMVDCIDVAAAAYDKRLNEAYAAALAVLDPESKEKLRIAQRAWLAFRRGEEAVEAGSWRADRGSAMRVVLALAALSALKERVGELRAYANEP